MNDLHRHYVSPRIEVYELEDEGFLAASVLSQGVGGVIQDHKTNGGITLGSGSLNRNSRYISDEEE